MAETETVWQEAHLRAVETCYDAARAAFKAGDRDEGLRLTALVAESAVSLVREVRRARGQTEPPPPADFTAARQRRTWY